MKRYPLYKDSGVEWIGKIPDHWDMKRIKYIANLIIEKAENTTEPVFKLALENIESHTGRWLNGINQFEGFGNNFKKGDVLFNKLRPYLAKVMVAPSDGVAVGELLILRPNVEVDNCFLFYRLLSKSFISIVDGATYGAKMPRANWDMVGNLKVPSPNSIEQEKIGKYLDHKTQLIDNLIKKKQRQIELLQEQRTAKINQAVTKGLNPNVKMKASGIEWLGEVPQEWIITRVKFLSNIISKGTTPTTMGREIADSGEVRFLKAENIINNNVSTQPEFFIDTETDELLKRSKLREHDVLFVIAGATIGKVAILGSDLLPANTNQAVSFIRPTDPNNSKFLWYWLQSSRIQENIWLDAVQSAQPNIAMEDLGNLPVPFPPQDERDEIIQFLNVQITLIDNLITKTEKEISVLNEYRTTLISEVVTGKIDVRDEVIP